MDKLATDIDSELAKSADQITGEAVGWANAYYHRLKNSYVDTSKTGLLWIMVRAVVGFYQWLVSYSKSVSDNQHVKTADEVGLMLFGEERRVIFGQGSPAYILVKIIVSSMGDQASRTLYAESNQQLNRYAYRISDPQRQNVFTPMYDFTYVQAGTYYCIFKAEKRGKVVAGEGEINAQITTEIGIDSVANVRGTIEYEGNVYETDENGFINTGSDTETIDHYRKRTDEYTLDSVFPGTKEKIENELYALGCEKVCVYENTDVITRNGVPGKHVAVSVYGGEQDKFFDVLEENQAYCSYYAIFTESDSGHSYIKIIDNDAGYKQLAYNVPGITEPNITVTVSRVLTADEQEVLRASVDEYMASEKSRYLQNEEISLNDIRIGILQGAANISDFEIVNIAFNDTDLKVLKDTVFAFYKFNSANISFEYGN